MSWGGAKDHGPLSAEAIERNLWNGAVTVAATPRGKAKMLHVGRKMVSFDFRHGNSL